jgi:hypothetical protein
VAGRSTKIDTIQELNIKGNAISNSQDIADYFNNFFSLVTGNSATGSIKTERPLKLLTARFSSSLSSHKISCCNVF